MSRLVLDEAPVNNTYNMVVRPDTAAQYKLETVSDLARVSKDLKLGAGPELDETSVAEMNYKVDNDKQEPRDVARAFLRAKGVVS